MCGAVTHYLKEIFGYFLNLDCYYMHNYHSLFTRQYCAQVLNKIATFDVHVLQFWWCIADSRVCSISIRVCAISISCADGHVQCS